MSKLLRSEFVIAVLIGILSLQSFSADARKPVILARADMPNGIIPQVEVRLVKHGGETVVQSAILSRFPSKVCRKIKASERKNWPGSLDAQAYVDALEEASAIYIEKHDPKTTALVIDFATSSDSAYIEIAFAAAVREKSGIGLQPAPAWRRLDLSANYIEKNQEYILADVFGKEAEPLIQTLRTSTRAEDGK